MEEGRAQPGVFASGPLPSRYHSRLIDAAIALNDNRLDVAERLLKPHLKEDPFDVAAIRMLAELAARIGRWKDAENLLRRAVELAPGWTAAKANLALVLGRMGRPTEALELLNDIFVAEPEEIGHWNLKAATLGRLGDFDSAIRLYEEVLAKSPMQPRVWLSYGHMLKTVGRQAEGIAAYRKAIEIRPQLGEAWWSLANLKTVKFDESDLSAMQDAMRSPGLTDEDRFHLDFALGKAMHDAGQAEAAFAHYSRANALRLKSQPFRPEEISRGPIRSINSEAVSISWLWFMPSSTMRAFSDWPIAGASKATAADQLAQSSQGRGLGTCQIPLLRAQQRPSRAVRVRPRLEFHD